MSKNLFIQKTISSQKQQKNENMSHIRIKTASAVMSEKNPFSIASNKNQNIEKREVYTSQNVRRKPIESLIEYNLSPKNDYFSKHEYKNKNHIVYSYFQKKSDFKF